MSGAGVPRIGLGLVLGAGGVVGQAYHAGVLAALEHDWGFDTRSVDVVVGTSAGSITGVFLRLGVSAADLAAWTVKAPLSGNHRLFHGIVDSPVPAFMPFQVRQLLLRPPKPPGWRMVGRALSDLRVVLRREVNQVIQQSFLAAGARASSPDIRPLMQMAGSDREDSNDVAR
jgi:predicted acylesterase/phospholipase RssA